MAAKAKSRRIRERRKHLGAWGILLIVLFVFGASTVAGIRLKQKNLTYQQRDPSIKRKRGARKLTIWKHIPRQKNMWKTWPRTSWDLSMKMRLFLKLRTNE